MTLVTELLHAASRGQLQAANELLPLVYDELRKLAAARLERESSDHTLQPTALVHEAWIKLVGTEAGQVDLRWEGARPFFAAAAEAMRRILVDHARRKKAQKRGGNERRERLEVEQLPLPQANEDLTAISEAVDRLAGIDEQAAELVKLRYFAGLPMREVAEILGMSSRSADRLWVFARSWLYADILRET